MEVVQKYLVLDTSEKQFETDIETSLLNDGYRKISPSEYDAERMIFPNVFIEFVKNSQAKQWSKYTRLYGDKAEEKIIRRLNDAISMNGLLHVLKNGFKDMGIDIIVCYSKPESGLNTMIEVEYSKNIIGETRQFPYSTKNMNTIDMVLSINGIPVFAFELKNQIKGQTYENAIKQWKEDRDYKEPVFKFNQRFFAFFAIDLFEVWMTTQLKGLATSFIPFNQGSNGAGNAGGKGNPANPSGYMTSYLWEIVFAKDSLIDLIFKFLTISEETKEEYVDGEFKKSKYKKIIFPRYHQYDVVHKILNDVKYKGSGNNYLIEHSAGSGKSNSIAWIAYRLASAYDKLDKPIFNSVIIVTNRIVLDNQLQETIESFDHRAGLVECITKSKGSRGLSDAINDNKKIIICTIQKFLYAYKDFDKFTGKNFAIVIDEAHQGQSGDSARTLKKSLTDIPLEIKKYAEENGINVENIDENDNLIMEIIAQGHHDNQSFFAFTATPTSKTLQIFGTLTDDGQRVPFHIYSMKQAIEEGFILDVLKNYTTIKQAFMIVKESNDNPELVENKTERALFRYYNSHDFTINQKVDMIMDNFLNNGRKKIDGHGKAMIICDSRHNAVKFYFAIKEYIKAHKDECEGCDALVAFSGMVKFDNDPVEYEESKINKDKDGHYITSDKKFREALHSDDFNILVCANKYQTGYDEPFLHSMYVDKKLRGVNAVQTLSRLNRTCKGKLDTFVLDFVNSSEIIRNSFEPFYGEILLEQDMDVNRVYDLRSKIDTFRLFASKQADDFYDLMNKNSGKKKQSSVVVGQIASLLKPVIDKYIDIKEEKDRFLVRDTLMKFNRCYSFVTQLVRLDDKELFKDYLFTSHLVHFLPKTVTEKIDITDKVELEYIKLTESFKGSIVLEEGKGNFKPSRGQAPSSKERKVNTLEKIIEKVNEQYKDDFNSGDKVALDSIYKMLMEDKVVKEKLKEFAKTNDANMFIKSIFPDEFRRVLVDCFARNDEAFNKLLNNADFQKNVMNIMAKELYKTLVGEKE